MNRKMKTYALYILAMIFLTSFGLNAAENEKSIEIKTPTVQCGMCKSTIEKTLNKLDGVISADVDIEKKTATVKYNTEETGPEEIRKTISRAGYQADDLKANKRKYKKLPHCCKLQEDR